MRRFYSPDISRDAGSIVLGADESAHATGVLRLRAGDRVSVFDGRGNEFLCEVASASKRGMELAVIATSQPPAPESPLDFTLAAALLKHDKYDLVVQKAVELGVTRLIPTVTARCDIPSKAADKRISRWERIVVESSKQCGRAVLMEIGEVEELGAIAERAEGTKLIFSERGGSRMPAEAVGSVTALVGPEGGWEDEEIELAVSKGFSNVTLGGRILRAETAAIAIAALVQNRFGDLG